MMVRHETAETRRTQLFRAALEVCAEKGFHEASADEIAARAGLSKGSLYYHFRSKEDLFLSMLESMVDEFALVLERAVGGEPAGEALQRATELMLAEVEATPGSGAALVEFYLLSLRGRGFRKQIRRHYERLIAAGAEVIRGGIERGEFDPSIDPEVAARILFLGADGVSLVHIALDEQEKGGRAVREFISRIIESFAKRKDRR